ncbi:hypothetical protein [Henriciella aquimarina]|uniref:hypothetical protein n=1 Tax=Henriciella aquimarina TaxID=545261 RepID=UPI000A01EFEE|nr:hypothetical protein [Henriciella aquimarina]
MAERSDGGTRLFRLEARTFAWMAGIILVPTFIIAVLWQSPEASLLLAGMIFLPASFASSFSPLLVLPMELRIPIFAGVIFASSLIVLSALSGMPFYISAFWSAVAAMAICFIDVCYTVRTWVGIVGRDKEGRPTKSFLAYDPGAPRR